MTEADQKLHDDKMRAEIAKIGAETVMLNKRIRWFEATMLLAVAGAVIAFTKLFL